MTRRDWYAWGIVAFVCVVVVPLVSCGDEAARPVSELAQPGPTWTGVPCEDALALCEANAANMDAALRRWEGTAGAWVATATADHARMATAASVARDGWRECIELSRATARAAEKCKAIMPLVEALAATDAVEHHAGTAEAVTSAWMVHVEAIQTEAAGEQAVWRKARGW